MVVVAGGVTALCRRAACQSKRACALRACGSLSLACRRANAAERQLPPPPSAASG